jgi:hypothetical protein
MQRTLTKEIDLETGVVLEEIYRLGGKLHRNPAEGPALIRRHAKTGLVAWESYHEHGALHRIDGPAEVEYFIDGQVGNETWFYRDSLHRDPKDGPAHVERWHNGVAVVPILTEYRVYGHPFRDPNDGPYRIERDADGRIEEELFAETPDMAAARRRHDAAPGAFEPPSAPPGG